MNRSRLELPPAMIACRSLRPGCRPLPWIALALLCALLPLATFAGPPPGHLDEQVRRLARQDPNATVRVIVQRTGDDGAIVRHRGKAIKRLPLVGATVAEVPAPELEALAREPGVRRVALDAPLLSQAKPEDDPAGTLRTVYPYVVRANELWGSSTSERASAGAGVGVAVIDSGVGRHTDLTVRLLAGADFTPDPGGGAYAGQDPNGHGTHVAGIIGGDGVSSGGAYVGIAPGVRLIDVRVSTVQGVAYTSGIIEAIAWAINARDRYNLRVINLSLVSSVAESYRTSLLDAAVELAWLKGIVVVVSAGNGGANSVLYPPANDPYVITVGATDDRGTVDPADDVVADFSSYGRTQDGYSKPDLVAPGRRIVSTLAGKNALLAREFPDRVYPGQGSNAYIRLSGTSAAAPMVSGAAALVLQAHPSWTPNQVKWVLMNTTAPVGTGRPAGAGAGYLNVAGAVRFGGLPQAANLGLVPSLPLAKAYVATHGGDVSWDNVQWGDVSWDNARWEDVAWGDVSWDNTLYQDVSWDSSQLD